MPTRQFDSQDASSRYRSFLVRVWLEGDEARPPPAWQAEVQHIQSGRRHTFTDRERLLLFLDELTLPAGAAGDDRDEPK